MMDITNSKLGAGCEVEIEIDEMLDSQLNAGIDDDDQCVNLRLIEQKLFEKDFKL